MWETLVWFLGWQDPLEEGMATHSNILGLPGGSDGKESTCNAGDPSLIPGLGRSPGEGNSNPLQYWCLENPHGQRSMVGYNSWGCKELDMTDWVQHSTSLDKKHVLLLWKIQAPFNYSSAESVSGDHHRDMCDSVLVVAQKLPDWISKALHCL